MTERKFQGISVYLPPEDHKKLRILAAEKETTITALAEEAIRDLFTKYEKEEGK